MLRIDKSKVIIMSLQDLSKAAVQHWCDVCWGLDKDISGKACPFCAVFFVYRDCSNCPLSRIGLGCNVSKVSPWNLARGEVDVIDDYAPEYFTAEDRIRQMRGLRNILGVHGVPDFYCLRMLEILVWLHVAIINDYELTRELGGQIMAHINDVLPVE